MAFEKGNKLAAKGGEFAATVKRALAQDDYARLRQCAETLLDLAAIGEQWAVLLLRDTLDGKPAQQLIATDEDGHGLSLGLLVYSAEVRPDHPLPVHPPALPAPDPEGPGQRH